MNDDLISKKDLLLETGISYGQLYRWKRKDLIPEEWFIRKSTYTGQETFFPKSKILERIGKIQALKDTVSLDVMASMFSPSGEAYSFEATGSAIQGLVAPTSLALYIEQTGQSGTLDFDQMLGLYVLDSLLQSGKISLEEGKMVIQLLMGEYPKESTLMITRKMGVSTGVLATSAASFDSQTKIVAEVELLVMAEQLKSKLI